MMLFMLAVGREANSSINSSKGGLSLYTNTVHFLVTRNGIIFSNLFIIFGVICSNSGIGRCTYLTGCIWELYYR